MLLPLVLLLPLLLVLLVLLVLGHGENRCRLTGPAVPTKDGLTGAGARKLATCERIFSQRMSRLVGQRPLVN